MPALALVEVAEVRKEEVCEQWEEAKTSAVGRRSMVVWAFRIRKQDKRKKRVMKKLENCM